MTSNPGLLRGTFWLIVTSGIPMLAFGVTLKIAPATDPMELVTGAVQVVDTPESRAEVLHLLARARKSLALRSAGQPYDLKVNFTIDSLGQTNYDAWEMEDLFVPGQGLHWTAKAAAGYQITAISTKGETYAEGTASAIPLRLHEARGLLFEPIPSTAYANRGSIRTSRATFHGATVTCVLLYGSRNASNSALGRGWEETEECIDLQSGLLRMHSELPGRYAVYDYSNAPQLGDHILPRRLTVTEAGRVVSEISVESLQGISTADPSLFVPTDAMKAGLATVMTSAKKISRLQGDGPFTSTMTARPVCVFGMVTSTGQLVEAHSLQPSDPNSQAAVEDAKRIDFSPTIPGGLPPRQHFVFVIEKFVSPQ